MPLNSAGFSLTSYDDRRAALAEFYQSIAGGNVSTAEGTVSGDLITLLALGCQEVAELDAAVYAAAFARTASGASLDRAVSWYVGRRHESRASTVVLPLTGSVGTFLDVDSAVRITGETTRWLLLEGVTLTGVDDEGTFEAEEDGPLTAVAGSTWQIMTPTAGWTAVGPNAADATVGADEESDETYRTRAALALDAGSIEAAVWQVPGVTLISLQENVEDTPDTYWGKTKWIELLVVGGTDEAVAAAIHSARPSGIQTLGNTTVNVAAANYLPAGTVPIKFSRAEEIDVWLAVEITMGEGYPTATGTEAQEARAALVKTAILAWGASKLRPGVNVSPFQVAAAVANVFTGIDAVTVLVGTADPPVSSAVLQIGIREVAVLDADRIEVTEV
jgi:uncharacterized phage protein gp47/JayE